MHFETDHTNGEEIKGYPIGLLLQKGKTSELQRN
jgi:hypothetical protein